MPNLQISRAGTSLEGGEGVVEVAMIDLPTLCSRVDEATFSTVLVA